MTVFRGGRFLKGGGISPGDRRVRIRELVTGERVNDRVEYRTYAILSA